MAKFEKKKYVPEEKQTPIVTAEIPSTQAAAAVDITPGGENTMPFPAQDTEQEDKPHFKDSLLNNHQFRLNNKRRFLMDALCRALNCDMYLLEADKKWAPNPLGRGDKIDIRYSREFPTIYIVYDKFGVMPSPELLHLKQSLAHENGYKYIYDTPEHALTHERLTGLLEAQKHIAHPELLALSKIKAAGEVGNIG